MRSKPYYSVRTGKNPLAGVFDLDTVRTLLRNVFTHFEDEGYFQEALGYVCVDTGFTSGTLGQDIEGIFLIKLCKKNLAPIRTKIESYSEDDMFDMIEFLYEHCSKPIAREWHDWNNCGWHCSYFKREPGRLEFREKINEILARYDKGYELSNDGEILSLADTGLDALFEAPLPTVDPQNISARVEAASTKFRRYRSSIDERRDAIRNLADVLEYLRPKLKHVLTKEDESDLFNIVNNFGIRHHRQDQKTDYDKPIWYSWLFYYYLATIHAAVRLIERSNMS